MSVIEAPTTRKTARQIWNNNGNISVAPTSRGTWSVEARKGIFDEFKTKRFTGLTIFGVPGAVADALDWISE